MRSVEAECRERGMEIMYNPPMKLELTFGSERVFYSATFRYTETIACSKRISNSKTTAVIRILISHPKDPRSVE
jgi:hypothetical protein